MNSGATTERVYDVLKRQIMEHGFRPGDRLDPAVLADQMAASVTPVRDALHMCVGEGLVEAHSGTGFYLPMLDEPSLKDLYAWSAELITLAIRRWPKTIVFAETSISDIGQSIAGSDAELFGAIARRSLNDEHARAIEMLNARLGAVRVIEPQLLEDVGEEVQAIATAFDAGDKGMLQHLCQAYHRRRLRIAADIVRLVYRRE